MYKQRKAPPFWLRGIELLVSREKDTVASQTKDKERQFFFLLVLQKVKEGRGKEDEKN